VRAESITAFVLLKLVTVPLVAMRLSATVLVLLIERLSNESVLIAPAFEIARVRAESITAFVLLKFVTVPLVAIRLSVTVLVLLIERLSNESVLIAPAFEIARVRAESMTAFVLLKFVIVPFVAIRLSVTVLVVLIERLFNESLVKVSTRAARA
jgi:hypothetical protein